MNMVHFFLLIGLLSLSLVLSSSSIMGGALSLCSIFSFFFLTSP